MKTIFVCSLHILSLSAWDFSECSSSFLQSQDIDVRLSCEEILQYQHEIKLNINTLPVYKAPNAVMMES